jgi:hypothetical protein
LWNIAKDILLPNSWRHYHNEKTNQMASIFSDEGIDCCLTHAYIPQSTYSTRTLRNSTFTTLQNTFQYTIDLFDWRFYKILFIHKRMKVNDGLFDGMLHITFINSCLVIYNN